VNRSLTRLAITATIGSLLSSSPIVAQVLPPAKKAAHVEIIQAPALELARENFAIIRWTCNNPGGTDDHYGTVKYGTSPGNLNQIANSHIRLNRGHSETVFRVSVSGLKPQTTYYYTVGSMESDGTSDGVESPVSQFTTPGPGK
jgi:hypothetical protein